jgi:hypothetical protein
MSSPTSGLLETFLIALATVVTWIFTPKTRRKISQAMSGKVNDMTDLFKIKSQIIARAPSTNAAVLIFGQFMHETANAQSAIFRNNNNMFGMKHPTRRPTLSVDSVNGYAAFGSTSDSIDDLLMWFDSVGIDVGKINDTEAYVAALKANRYFEDNYENYLRGVKAGSAKFFQVL